MSDVALIGLRGWRIPGNVDCPRKDESMTSSGGDVLTAGGQATEAAASKFSALEIGQRRLDSGFTFFGRALTPTEKQALDEYVSQGVGSEQRAKASEQITHFIQNGHKALILSDLGLTRLPDIVKTLRVETLDVSGNKLQELPLPAEVAYLHASSNALTVMPVLPEGTRMVFVSDNRIREFRAPLPDTLTQVYAGNNALDAAPPFPASLMFFDIAGNTGRLTQAEVDAKLGQRLEGQTTRIPA